jgi:Cu(I)/Ag(I) efflux system periplasmic protein CusF
MKQAIAAIALSVVTSFSLSVPARANHDASGSAAALADGEVRKVDKPAKKLTIRHGPLENLGMPPMTMVFQVSEPGMLDAVSAGDKVKFFADKVGGAYTVTHLEPVR